jgi:hypothetical protein
MMLCHLEIKTILGAKVGGPPKWFRKLQILKLANLNNLLDLQTLRKFDPLQICDLCDFLRT